MSLSILPFSFVLSFLAGVSLTSPLSLPYLSHFSVAMGSGSVWVFSSSILMRCVRREVRGRVFAYENGLQTLSEYHAPYLFLLLSPFLTLTPSLLSHLPLRSLVLSFPSVIFFHSSVRTSPSNWSCSERCFEVRGRSDARLLWHVNVCAFSSLFPSLLSL
jgi:hypothetical protein